MTGVIVAALVIGLPAFVFVLWPLVKRRDLGGPASLGTDERESLLETKRVAFRALRELEFEHGAGHVSEDDYRELRARYEGEAAEVLSKLDRLGPRPPVPLSPAPTRGSYGSWWRHPMAVALAAVGLIAFGIVLGTNLARNTAPDQAAGRPMPGSRPLATLTPPSPSGTRDSARGPIAPEMLRGMLAAARQSLFEGRYSEAIAAYQAVLKRDPKNVDAITHLGLIVAIGGHADAALESFERALALDPNYPPALLYRGQVLDEAKHDTEAAIQSWEKFVAVAPAGEDRERVRALITEARERAARPRGEPARGSR